MNTKKIQLQVSMEVTVPQALTLKAMFEYWNKLSMAGSSRTVSFYVDGDGNFHPNCELTTDVPIPELTDEIRKIAVVEDVYGDRKYEFNGVAWYLNKD